MTVHHFSDGLPLPFAQEQPETSRRAPAGGHATVETTPTETVLAGILEAVLGTANVDLDANLFELGGNSLHATRAVSRINKTFGVKASVRMLYSDSTVRSIAHAIDELRTTCGEA